MTKLEKRAYIKKQVIRGLILLALIILSFLLAKKNLQAEQISWLEPLYNKPGLVFFLFSLSEMLSGIIPPELFMIWGLQASVNIGYWYIIAILSVISYVASFIDFSIGKYLQHTRYYRYVRKRYLQKYEQQLEDFGGALIIIAALTPLPFAAIAMLIGAGGYPTRQYLLYSLSRIVRFFIYGWILDQINYL